MTSNLNNVISKFHSVQENCEEKTDQSLMEELSKSMQSLQSNAEDPTTDQVVDMKKLL